MKGGYCITLAIVNPVFYTKNISSKVNKTSKWNGLFNLIPPYVCQWFSVCLYS